VVQKAKKNSESRTEEILPGKNQETGLSKKPKRKNQSEEIEFLNSGGIGSNLISKGEKPNKDGG
jgi:hypothetical protein